VPPVVPLEVPPIEPEPEAVLAPPVDEPTAPELPRRPVVEEPETVPPSGMSPTEEKQHAELARTRTAEANVFNTRMVRNHLSAPRGSTMCCPPPPAAFDTNLET